MAKKLKLLLNIGTTDNKLLGLEKTSQGTVVTVDDEKAAMMVKSGWALPPDEADELESGAAVDVPVSTPAKAAPVSPDTRVPTGQIIDKTPPAKVPEKK